MDKLHCYLKKNDPKLLKNWRPVSLMNLDYKILSKTLTMRLKKIMHHIVNINQACGVKGRKMTDHLLYILYLQEFINCPHNKRPGTYILCMDQEKAFDRVEHLYMFKVLEKMKLGSQFIRWIRTIYTKNTSMATVNGHLTDTISIGRGIHQGCFISMLLFVLTIEPLLAHIRLNKCLALKSPVNITCLCFCNI